MEPELRHKSRGCENWLPSVMNKDSNCKSLKLTCEKLKNKCKNNLGNAIGNTPKARRCRAALKLKARTKVHDLCTSTCKTSGKRSCF